MKSTIIVGGGITGLSLAYFLQQAGVPYVLVEASARWGGKIGTRRQEGFVLEEGPEACVMRLPEISRLFDDLGLRSQLLTPASTALRVWDRQKLRSLPEGWLHMRATRLAPFVKADLITWPGKLRMGWEYFLPPREEDGDESLGQFVRRRFGSEALNKVFAPVFANIHAADPEQLSLHATLPVLQTMEHEHGGMIRAMLAAERRKKDSGRASDSPPTVSLPPMASLAGGMQGLVCSLLHRLDPNNLRLGTGAVWMGRVDNQWQVNLNGAPPVAADNLVLALPSYQAAALITRLDQELAADLYRITYVSTATVSLAYRSEAMPPGVRASGWVVARGEASPLRACSWTSAKYPGHAPQGTVLLRAFLGGAGREGDIAGSRDDIARLARQELQHMLGISAEPVLTFVSRYAQGQPQYRVGHKLLIERIETGLRKFPGIQLAGSGLYGSGIPNCIASARHAADHLLRASA